MERRVVIMKKFADHAVPRLTEPADTAAEKVSAARTHITAIKNSPHTPSAPEVETATAAWNTETDNLDANNKTIADLTSRLAVAHADN
jgi:hypothetical protein